METAATAQPVLPADLRSTSSNRLVWVLGGLRQRNARTRFRALADYFLDQRVSEFESLDAVDAVMRTTLKEKVRSRLNGVAVFLAVEDALLDGAYMGLWLALGAGLLAGLVISHQRVILEPSWEAALVVLTTLVYGGIFLGLIVLVYGVAPESPGWVVGVSGTVVIVCTGGIWSATSSNPMWDGNPTRYLVLAVSIATTIVVTYALVGFLAPKLPDVLSPRRQAEAALIDHLIRSTKFVSASPIADMDLASKNRVLSDLERTAWFYERAMARELRCGDLITDRWLKDRTAGMGAYVRQLKQCVLMPARESADEVKESLANALVAIASGNWHELPAAEVTAVSARERWFGGLVRLGRASLGGLPLAAFAIWQSTPNALQGPFASSIWGITILWALLSLASLEPGYGQKVETVLKMLPSQKG